MSRRSPSLCSAEVYMGFSTAALERAIRSQSSSTTSYKKRPLPPKPESPRVAAPSSMEPSVSRPQQQLIPPSPMSTGFRTALSSPSADPSHVSLNPPPYAPLPPAQPQASNRSSPNLGSSSTTTRSSPSSPYNASRGNYHPTQPSPLGQRTSVDVRLLKRCIPPEPWLTSQKFV